MLTLLATLKARLIIPEADVKDDVLLTNFILSASARFEAECKRTFGRNDAATEEFQGDETEIRGASYPIDAAPVASFHLKTTETAGWELQSGVDFIVRRKCVISLSEPLGTFQQQARVTYAGGYVLPGATASASQTALPDDLEQACVEQCAYWYQNRNRLGLVGIGGEGSSIQQFATLDLLPNVKAVLKLYERWLN